MNHSEKLRSFVLRQDDKELSKDDWSGQTDFYDYLKAQQTANQVLLYGSGIDEGSLIIEAFFVPKKSLAKIPKSRLYDWDNPMSDLWSCGEVWGGGEPPRVEFNVNNLRIGQKVITDSQNLVFRRSFEGRSQDKNYYEIAQFFTHAHGLHWVPERQAWSKFDDQGDIEDSIQLHEVIERGDRKSIAITVDREILELHLTATDTVLVQVYDCTRWRNPFHAWPEGPEDKKIADDCIFYKIKNAGAIGSYSRGVSLIRPKLTPYELGAKLHDKDKVKEYETFITQDWKNRRIAEVSCSPDALASYFEKDSDLPLQQSPVFFNADVLNKYKADPDKYSMEHRSISCRNSWYLKTYDINEAGQVHTYITYLGNLPFKEQTYWKSFNEPPKAPISKRAYTTDFEGSFDVEPDPLQDLIRTIKQLHSDRKDWFYLKSEELTGRIHYPATTSNKEWEDALITLNKLVIESLEQGPIQRKAQALGAKGDPTWRSIKWMGVLLECLSVEGEQVQEIIQPFRDLQFLRTKLSAHANGQEAAKIRADLLREHKTSKNHIINLCERLEKSLSSFSEIYDLGTQ